jgi:hypothetical protein
LGAKAIEITQDDSEKIRGIANFDLLSEDYKQEFCWDIKNIKEISEDVFKLLQFIYDNKLISIDKIIVSADELGKQFKEKYGLSFKPDQFEEILNALLCIDISMIDDNEKTDSYFIHM